MIRGYARVSTDGQSVNAQAAQLRAAGAEIVFRETASGAKTDRAQLRRVVAQLGEGDVLLVTRLDRLAAPGHAPKRPDRGKAGAFHSRASSMQNSQTG
jgi:DNA invertase Pin-like site-specific DNA recombinase